MVENMLFLYSEHVGMGNAPPKKVVCLFMVDAWFLKIILIGYDFLLQLLLGMQPKFTCKISLNSKDSV